MTSNISQGYLFLIFILIGILIGVLFDIFRILRKTFKTSDLITYIQDILFWLITGIILIYSILILNNGELRAYIFLSLFIGITTYILTISKHFVNLNVTILTLLKNIITFILKTISYPFKCLFKIIKKILTVPAKHLKKIFSKIKVKSHNLINFKKKRQNIGTN